MLEVCILDLSKSAGFQTWWQCRKRLKRNEPYLKKNDPAYALITSGLDEFIRAATQAENTTAKVAPQR